MNTTTYLSLQELARDLALIPDQEESLIGVVDRLKVIVDAEPVLAKWYVFQNWEYSRPHYSASGSKELLAMLIDHLIQRCRQILHRVRRTSTK